MSSFKKTNVKSFAKTSQYINTDTQYWKNYEFPITVKEFTSIDFIDVSQIEPYYIAVTTGPKIDIYHQQTAQVWRSLTRFQKGAYGGRFRKDGQLLVAGSEEAQVKLFNYRHKQVLRIFKGHTGPVHRADFICNKPQLVSFSDDKTISLWDITEEKELTKFDEHKDFIRAGVTNPASEHIIISGSYDHTVKVWDSRSGSSVMSFNHGSPVESVICYPSGSVLASAGGSEVKIWDAVGGKLLSILSQHHKTITCLSLATNNTRLLSGSLDRHIKVYDLNTYSTLHSMTYPASILSLGVAPKDSTLVTGMLSGGSGLLSFEQRVTSQIKSTSIRKTDPRNARVKNYKILPGDEVITHIGKDKLTRYDKMLSRFEFTKTLDIVMQRGTAHNSPHITVAVLREIIRRGGLSISLAGRDSKSLSPIFRFLIKNIRNPNFHRILIEVSNTLIDIYSDSISENSNFVTQLSRLNEELEMEILVSRNGMSLMGAIEMFIASSASKNANQEPLINASKEDSVPSNISAARGEEKQIIVNVC